MKHTDPGCGSVAVMPTTPEIRKVRHMMNTVFEWGPLRYEPGSRRMYLIDLVDVSPLPDWKQICLVAAMKTFKKGMVDSFHSDGYIPAGATPLILGKVEDPDGPLPRISEWFIGDNRDPVKGFIPEAAGFEWWGIEIDDDTVLPMPRFFPIQRGAINIQPEAVPVLKAQLIEWHQEQAFAGIDAFMWLNMMNEYFTQQA